MGNKTVAAKAARAERMRRLAFAAYDTAAENAASNAAFIHLRSAMLTTREKPASATEWEAAAELLRAISALEKRMAMQVSPGQLPQDVYVLDPSGGELVVSRDAFDVLDRVWRKHKAELPLGAALAVQHVDELLGAVEDL